MKTFVTILVAAAISLAMPVRGQGAADCSRAANPERCRERQAAAEGCRGLAGAERRRCVQDRMPPADCSKATQPARCVQQRAALDACRDKVGPAFRECMREQWGTRGGSD